MNLKKRRERGKENKLNVFEILELRYKGRMEKIFTLKTVLKLMGKFLPRPPKIETKFWRKKPKKKLKEKRRVR